MSRLALSTCLLLVIFSTTIAWPVRQLYRRINKSPDKQYLIAPELFHDRSIAMATISHSESTSRTFVELALIVTDKRCKLTIPPEPNAINTGVDSIRWLMDGSILMATRYVFRDAGRRMKLIIVDMETCEYNYAYPDFFPENYKIFTSAIPTENDNQFAVFAYDRAFCGDVKWCRFVYNNPRENTFESLDFDFPWEGIDVQPATTFDGQLFVVRTHDTLSRTYRIRLYYATRRWYKAPLYEEMMSVPSSEDIEVEKYLMPGRTGILSSGLNVCWISKWNAKTIHCAKFDEEGRLMFNKTLNYPEPLILFGVKSVSGGLLLLTKKYECKDEDCMDIYATEIINEFKSVRDNYLDPFDTNMPQGDDLQLIRYRKMRIECSHPEVIQAQVYQCADDAMGRVYVCDNGEQLLYHYIAVRHHTNMFY